LVYAKLLPEAIAVPDAEHDEPSGRVAPEDVVQHTAYPVFAQSDPLVAGAAVIGTGGPRTPWQYMMPIRPVWQPDIG